MAILINTCTEIMPYWFQDEIHAYVYCCLFTLKPRGKLVIGLWRLLHSFTLQGGWQKTIADFCASLITFNCFKTLVSIRASPNRIDVIRMHSLTYNNVQTKKHKPIYFVPTTVSMTAPTSTFFLGAWVTTLWLLKC